MMKKLALAAALAAMICVAPAAAQTGDPVPVVASDQAAELNCLVVSLTLMNDPEPQRAQAGLMGFLYWLGRLDGAAPEFPLEERIRALAPTLSEEFLQAEAQRCGREMTERGTEVQTIGQSLTASGL
jgi:hypothetical protein